jgi:hypothetical protein
VRFEGWGEALRTEADEAAKRVKTIVIKLSARMTSRAARHIASPLVRMMTAVERLSLAAETLLACCARL